MLNKNQQHCPQILTERSHSGLRHCKDGLLCRLCIFEVGFVTAEWFGEDIMSLFTLL